MPVYTIEPPIAKGEAIEGFYHLPDIEGVSGDEVRRMEAMPFWKCNVCYMSSPVTDQIYTCGSEAHDPSYVLCQTCHSSGARCEPHQSQHELFQVQTRLEHNIEHYYKRTPVPSRHIRVLHISPSPNFEDPLDGVVSVKSVDDPLEYNALSYVWGSPAKPKLIRIGHCLHPITSNLDLALRRCRDPERDVTIWTDAICINQSDNVEKATQIAMMRDIYKNAFKTYIYLGENDNNLRVDLLTDESRERLHEASREDQRLAGVAMGALLNRDWFSRVWVVQEVASSIQCVVLMGNVSFDYKVLYESIEIIKSDSPFSTVLLQVRQIQAIAKNFKPAHIANMKRFWVEKQFGNTPEKQQHFRKIEDEFRRDFRPFPYPLINLLESFRHRDATDPRDKIYAFLGLATDIHWEHDGERTDMRSTTGTPVPQPDYTRSVQDVYYDYACYFATGGYWCDMLHSASLNSLGSSRLSGLPSWAPDWTSCVPGVQSKRFNQHFGQRLYHAGGFDGVANACVTPQSRTLSISGRLVDKITYLSEPWKLGDPRRPDITACMDDFIRNTAFCKSVAKAGFEALTVRDALVYNCIDQVLDCEDCRESAPLWLQSIAVAMTSKYSRTDDSLDEETRRQYLEFSNKSSQANEAGDKTALDEMDPLEQAFQGLFDTEPLEGRPVTLIPTRQYVHEVISSRRFCFTERGRIGLVPMQAEVDDVIAVIKGGTTPYVLRADGEDWKFIGDSYIRGIMQGESLENEDFVEMPFGIK